MRRSRPRSVYTFHDQDGDPGMTADQILVSEEEISTFSGLYDAKGNKLYRQSETVPFGFRKGK
jgi:hypothetical protein